MQSHLFFKQEYCDCTQVFHWARIYYEWVQESAEPDAKALRLAALPSIPHFYGYSQDWLY
jgi:hypothetical protein